MQIYIGFRSVVLLKICDNESGTIPELCLLSYSSNPIVYVFPVPAGPAGLAPNL